MATIQQLAKAVLVERKALKSSEARIAWLENELKDLKRRANLGAVQEASSDGEIENSEDAIEVRRGGIPFSVSCVNNPGQAVTKPPLPPDHEHQGVYAILAQGCGLAQMHFVGTIELAQFEEDSVGLIVQPGTNDDGTYAFVPDRGNQFGPNHPDVPGDGEDVICGAGMSFTHLPVPGGVHSPNRTPGGDIACTNACGTSKVTTKEMVRQTNCGGVDKAFYFAGGPFHVDCNGHIHSMTEHVLYTPFQVENNAPTWPGCCTQFNVITGISWQCIETPLSGNGKQFTMKMVTDQKLVIIPQDTWNIDSDPSPGADEVIVVTGITAVDKGGCSCAKTIGVTKALAKKSHPTGTTIDVVTTVCYDSSSCEIKVKKTTITVLAKGTEGSATAINAC